MADDTQDLELEPEDAGLQFRAEMWATNFVLGNWKVLITILIVGLLSVLAYGQWQSFVQATQREIAAQVADAERVLPTPIATLPDYMQQNPDDDKTTPEKLAEVAAKLEAVGGATSGPGSVEAFLKASELYRLAEMPDKQRAALEQATGSADAILAYTAKSALANLELEQGQGDAAVERFRDLMTTSQGMLAEQAALDLGLALEHLDRDSEAGQVYADFLAKWPESTRADEVRTRQSRLGGGEG